MIKEEAGYQGLEAIAGRMLLEMVGGFAIQPGQATVIIEEAFAAGAMSNNNLSLDDIEFVIAYSKVDPRLHLRSGARGRGRGSSP